jgi:hypothetical protein
MCKYCAASYWYQERNKRLSKKVPSRWLLLWWPGLSSDTLGASESSDDEGVRNVVSGSVGQSSSATVGRRWRRANQSGGGMDGSSYRPVRTQRQHRAEEPDPDVV